MPHCNRRVICKAHSICLASLLMSGWTDFRFRLFYLYKAAGMKFCLSSHCLIAKEGMGFPFRLTKCIILFRVMFFPLFDECWSLRVGCFFYVWRHRLSLIVRFIFKRHAQKNIKKCQKDKEWKENQTSKSQLGHRKPLAHASMSYRLNEGFSSYLKLESARGFFPLTERFNMHCNHRKYVHNSM